MAFTDVFGGSSIYPSDVTYLALALTADVELNWPIEQQIGGPLVVADIMDIEASVVSLSITMPDARNAAQGFTALFNNIGAEVISIRNAAGGVIATIAPGSAWQLYLTDNTTEAGTWRSFQYGASVSVVNAAALVGNGMIAIGATLSLNLDVTSTSTSPLALDANSRARIFNWTGTALAASLPVASDLGDGWFTILRNSGSGDITITPTTSTIDGSATKVIAPGSSCIVVSDGTNYITLFEGGTGSSASFNILAVDIAGGGDYTLAGVQLGQVGYRLTGILTANRNLIVPTSVAQYWVDNQTTGAFSVTVKTAAGTGVVVAQGLRNILYCDGTNVVIADSAATIVIPVTIAQGGTNATDAGTARTNLGLAIGTNVPSPTGGGASGTWGIDISGNAATATLAAAATVAGSITSQGALATLSIAPVANGGTGASDAATARTNLGITASPMYGAAKTGSTGRSATTSPTADPDLQLTALPAGTYAVDIMFSYNQNSAGAQGITMQLGGTNATIYSVHYECQNTGTANVANWQDQYKYAQSFGGTGSITHSTPGIANSTVKIKAMVVLSGTGTIELLWAQASSNVNPTSVEYGIITAQKVA